MLAGGCRSPATTRSPSYARLPTPNRVRCGLCDPTYLRRSSRSSTRRCGRSRPRATRRRKVPRRDRDDARTNRRHRRRSSDRGRRRRHVVAPAPPDRRCHRHPHRRDWRMVRVFADPGAVRKADAPTGCAARPAGTQRGRVPRDATARAQLVTRTRSSRSCAMRSRCH